MKSKKILILFGIMAVVLLVIAGCGQTTPTASTAQPAANSAPAPASAQAAAPAPVAKAEPTKTIYEQWKTTGHAIYFPARIASGAEGMSKAGYKDTCTRCHSAVVRLDDPKAVLNDFLPGGKYAGKDEGISCRVCHTSDGTNKGAWQLREKGWDACITCHTAGGRPKLTGHVSHPQGEFIKGLAPEGSGLKDMPSVKFQMGSNFSCMDCHMKDASHTFLVPGDTTVHDPKDPIIRTEAKLDYTKFQEVFNQDKCKTCHTGDKDAKHMADLVKTQQEEIEKRLEAMKKINDEWAKKVAAMTPDQQKADPKVKAFTDGATYYGFVEADSSKGVHNIEFAKALLDAADKAWAALK